MHSETMDPAAKAAEVARTVRGHKSSRWWRYLVAALAVLSVAGAVTWFFYPREVVHYWVSAPAKRGDLVLSATATGDLQPKRTVTIGAEISGMIKSVEVEANDHVKAGQVLLRFDTETLDNALEQAKASLAAARANQRRAQATVEATKVEYERTLALANKKMASQSELDQKRADKLRAVADLESAKASVARSRAEVAAAQTKLEKATITSPIDGVVLARNVEGGNTVTSTLQSPELFVLAEDLSQMVLDVAVDEADIGLVAPGQKAEFSVDAWPERTFAATVKTVSLSPTVTDNVVTYTAELTVDNSEGLLRPGMTATATITTGVHKNVLRVPNAALRFSPKTTSSDGGGPSLLPMHRRWGSGSRQQKPGHSVWVLRNGQPTRVNLETGRSDGRFTEVLGGDLSEGDRVVLAERSTPPPADGSKAPNGARPKSSAPQARGGGR